MVRTTEHLQALVGSDPFGAFAVAPGAKRIVTFLRDAADGWVALPVERDGARILTRVGTEAFSVYAPIPKGLVFMTLLERTFGKDITTRTLATAETFAAA